MLRKMIEKLRYVLQRFTPKPVVGGKCPRCGATVPKGEPFWCYWCKQALDYSKKERF